MNWKVALTIGLLLAKPVIKAVNAWVTEHLSQKEFYRETGGCGIRTEELKKLAWERNEDIEEILNQKGLTQQQKEAALRYVDGYRYSEFKRDEMLNEVQKSKEWAAAHYSSKNEK